MYFDERLKLVEFGIDIRKRHPRAIPKAIRRIYAAQVAHKDFRRILRKMED